LSKLPDSKEGFSQLLRILQRDAFPKKRWRFRAGSYIQLDEIPKGEGKQHKEMARAIHGVTYRKIASLESEEKSSAEVSEDFQKIFDIYTNGILFGFRIRMFKNLFKGLILWTILVLIIVVGNMFVPTQHKISSGVLEVLLGTTTANVIGLIAIAAKWLFPGSEIRTSKANSTAV
jgi:hypothetical protein